MAKNTVIILSSDRENWSSIEEQIMQYLDMDPRHRDRIPFLFIEEFQERVLEEPPTWIDSQSVLRRLWKVAGLLALMYKQPLHEAGFLDNVHRSSDRDSEFADEKLARFGAEQKGGDGYDLEYLKKWRRLMQSFLRTASVAQNLRERASAEKIDSLMRYLGQNVDQELRIYLCSGTSIVYWGLRETSLDVDLKVEGGSIGQILREAKQKLNINIEPEHPGRFIPLLPTWRDRSPFIRKEGNISFFHFDPYSVVVSKIVRGEEKDWADIHSLIESGRVDPQRLRSLYFEAEYQNELKERFELDIQRISEHVKLLDKENK